ncbi:MAG: tellurium resistance protein TehB [Sulfurospirillum sp.]|nr:MAG: tellurium resistance protein TehB [Sulfurospirillum sp.]
MSQKDKIKWNEKFRSNPELLAPREPSSMLKQFLSKEKNHIDKTALDLACGGGRHTLYLANLGFKVDAVDISKVALDSLKEKIDLDLVSLIESDLDQFSPEANRYDLIVMSNFLDRELIKRSCGALKIDGVFFVETYMDDPNNEKQNSNPNFLLQKDELKEIFKGFEILEYREFWNEPYEIYRMKKEAVLARRLI